MKKLIFAALLAGALVLPILAIAGAASQEKPFQATFAGLWTNKDDLSYTGVVSDSTGIGFFQGKSSLGNYTAQGAATSGYTGKECAGLNNAKGVEGQMKGSSYVFTFDDTGDQLFLRLAETKASLYCAVVGVGAAGNTNLQVMGGTGRFEGATGSIVKTWKIGGLANPGTPPKKGMFSVFNGTFEGTVVLASGKAWPF